MNASREFEFLAICPAVRRYQRQIVLSVRTGSTLVPLAKRDEFFRLRIRPYFAGGGVIQQQDY